MTKASPIIIATMAATAAWAILASLAHAQNPSAGHTAGRPAHAQSTEYNVDLFVDAGCAEALAILAANPALEKSTDINVKTAAALAHVNCDKPADIEKLKANRGTYSWLRTLIITLKTGGGTVWPAPAAAR